MLKTFIVSLLIFLSCVPVFSQDNPSHLTDKNNLKDRYIYIEEALKELSQKQSPGLNQTVDFSVSGASIQEFLRGLAEAHGLNISIDPSLNFKIVNNFNNEKVINVIVFLCREYGLSIRFTGSIMSFYKEPDPVKTPERPKPKDFYVNFSAYNDRLTLDLNNDTLSLVAKKITQTSKKNLVLAPGIGNKLVSAYIENMPFDNAIEKLAFSNNLRSEKTKDNFYTLEPAEQLASDNTNTFEKAGSFGAKKSGADKKNAVNSEIEITSDSLQKYVALSVVNQPVADLIKQIAKEGNINYFMFSEPKGNVTLKVSRYSVDALLSFLLQGTEHTYKKDGGVYLFGERSMEGLRTAKVVQLQYRSAEIIIDNIPADLKKGVEIKYFKELNSLIMTGSLPQITEISALIRQLDRIVPVISLEAIFVNVSKTRTVKTGLKAGFNDTIQSGGTVLPGIDYTLNSTKINDLLNSLANNNIVNLGKVNSSFYISLSALESQGDIDVQQTPKLSTLNGHEATLKIGETDYYSIETQNTLGSLTTNTIRTVQWNQIQANLEIKINPIVSGDDQVTLDIDFSNSSFKPRTATNAPVGTYTQSFKSMIRVKNEEMIALGGVESLQKTNTSSGIPILSRIPIIKWFFSSREKVKKKTKLLVFIRPTIYY